MLCKLYSTLKFLIVFWAINGITGNLLAQTTSWNPNAGVITSYANQTGVQITSSSGSNTAAINDNNPQTYWESAAPFPVGYFSQSQNILRNMGGTAQCTNSGGVNCANTTDANTNNWTTIPGQGMNTWVRYGFAFARPLYCLSIRLETNKPAEIWAFRSTGDSVLVGTYLPLNNYNTLRFMANVTNVTAIKVKCADYFLTVYEIAALSTAPIEQITMRLGSSKNIGWVDTYHFSGSSVLSARVFLSSTGTSWQAIGTLNPQVNITTTTLLAVNRSAQYIKVEYTIAPNDWAKAVLWEIDVYDRNGPYGPMPSPSPNPNTISSILGVNGEWGWGWFAGSDVLQPGQGAELFRRVGSHGRNFHYMNWDIYDPDDTPQYAWMASGGGTGVHNWLNWNVEYGKWRNAGLEIDACIEFNNVTQPQSVWSNPYQTAYNFGYNFATHFGNSGANLVKTVEIGNEPWNYSASFYRDVLHGMARGLKAADPSMRVLPAAFQAGFPEMEMTYTQNYMGARVSQTAAPYLDGINSHYYSYMWTNSGQRVSIYPEHPQSSMRGVLNDIRFRNANMPGKDLYVTEYGWDSNGAGESCTHSECSSEIAQCAYGLRGAFILMRLGAKRINWFQYANSMGGSTFFNRSGFTGSLYTNFAPKRSFKAMETVMNLVGQRRFLSVIREDANAYIYVLGRPNGTPTHIIAWRPISADIATTATVSFSVNTAPEAAWLLNGATSTGTPITLPSYNGGTMTLSIGSVPRLIQLVGGSGKTDDNFILENGTSDSQVWANKFYPNPSTTHTTIEVGTDRNTRVVLTAYNMLGQQVRQQNSEPLSVGRHQIVWDNTDLSKGVYFIKMDFYSLKPEEAATPYFSSDQKIVVR